MSPGLSDNIKLYCPFHYKSEVLTTTNWQSEEVLNIVKIFLETAKVILPNDNMRRIEE